MQSIIAARLIVLERMKEETHRRSDRWTRRILWLHFIAVSGMCSRSLSSPRHQMNRTAQDRFALCVWLIIDFIQLSSCRHLVAQRVLWHLARHRSILVLAARNALCAQSPKRRPIAIAVGKMERLMGYS